MVFYMAVISICMVRTNACFYSGFSIVSNGSRNLAFNSFNSTSHASTLVSF